MLLNSSLQFPRIPPFYGALNWSGGHFLFLDVLVGVRVMGMEEREALRREALSRQGLIWTIG
jgi:hypothetical protein